MGDDKEDLECTAHEHAADERADPDPEVIERAAAIFRAAGDPARLWILERLATGERCVSDLAQASGDGMSSVSQRLRILRSERLLRRRREGKHIYYALADDHVGELIRSALDHAAEGR